MPIIHDRSVVSDHFSNISAPKPPVSMPAPPAKMPAPSLPTPPVVGGGGSGKPKHHHGGHHGGGYGGGYGYGYPPVYGGYGGYVPMPAPAVVEVPVVPPVADVKKDEPATKQATKIDMMGVMPYVAMGAIGGVAGYFIAQSKSANVWAGAGIGAGVLVAGLLLYNQSQKK